MSTPFTDGFGKTVTLESVAAELSAVFGQPPSLTSQMRVQMLLYDLENSALDAATQYRVLKNVDTSDDLDMVTAFKMYLARLVMMMRRS